MECRADMPGNATGGHLFISCLFVVVVVVVVFCLFCVC